MTYRGLDDIGRDPWLDPQASGSDWYSDPYELAPLSAAPDAYTVPPLASPIEELAPLAPAYADSYRDDWGTDYLAHYPQLRRETYTPPVRPGMLRRARVAVALVAAAGLAIASGFVLSRQHGEAEAKGRTANPAATAPAQPRNPAPSILENGVINLSRAGSEGQNVPVTVSADKLSIAAVINYSNRKPAGMGWMISEGFGTGYVVKDADGNDVLATAAHVVDGVAQEGIAPEPNYAAAANVGGQFEEVPIDGIQVPASYDTNDTLNNPASLDLALARVATNGWQDGYGTVQSEANDFGALPAMSLSPQLPKVGALVFQLGERTGDGKDATWVRPPQSPAVADDVVIGYQGGRVYMIPINQKRLLTDWEGDSGSPMIVGGNGPNSGDAFGTFIEGEQMTEAQLEGGFGLILAGYAPEQEIHVNIATVDTPAAFDTVNGTAIQGTPNPGYYP